MTTRCVQTIWIVISLMLVASPAARAALSFDFAYTGNLEDTRTVLKVVDGGERIFRHELTNTGTEVDTYRLIIEAEYYTGDALGFGWTLCTTEVCQLPDLETFLTLGPAMSDSVTVKMYPFFDQLGGAKVTIRCTSVANPSLEETHSYAVIREGTEIVLIDDDGGADLQGHVLAGLALNSQSFAVYETALQPLSDATYGFADQHHLVYMSGDQSSNTITASDETILASYLDGGGRLLVSGQDLFDDLVGSSFASSYLGASALAQTSGSQVAGEAFDPVGDGLMLSIAGGAGNQVSPDVLAGDVLVASYDITPIPPEASAIVRWIGPNYLTLSCGFGLEGVDPAPLADFLSRASVWFDPAAADVSPTELATGAFRVQPNPVRGEGSLYLTLPSRFDGGVQVTFFDLSGRVVSKHSQSIRESGIQVIPFALRDRAGHALPAGIYPYRVEAGTWSARGKVTVVR